ncbi:DEAD-DEAH box helicase domain protein VrlS [Levilactobacillus brevis]|nr:DEAD-DEAH box helicase domain protein VrlS [Levilactobacillus brevis]
MILSKNEDVLRRIWARKKELELSTHRELYKQEDNWSKLLYYTFAALSNYLMNIENNHFSRDLQFSAKYFELLPTINDDSNLLAGDNELMLFGSAAYFFADYPGAANVALKPIDVGSLSFYEKVLYAVILNDGTFPEKTFGKVPTMMNNILLGDFSEDSLRRTLSEKLMRNSIDKLTDSAYKDGIDENILAAECVSAVVLLKIKHSTLRIMSEVSGGTDDYWKQVIQDKKVERTLWASQRALGEHGVFSGRSAVVQMPTGAGKTASISLILRSALSKEKLRIAIIVAPFKSIRDEIYQKQVQNFQGESIQVNRLSTDLKMDFGFIFHHEKPRVLIVTPEKLLFMIRHSNDLLFQTDLIVFDEAHQLDNSERGITFELLLVTIRQIVPEKVQKIFISAVVGNPETISEWFNAGNNVEITGVPEKRYSNAYGWAVWNKKTNSGDLFFKINVGNDDRWTPYSNVVNPVKVKRILEPNFSRKSPVKAYKWVTILYAIHFMSNGMVAVFSPRKDTISGIAAEFTKYAKLNDSFSSILNVNEDTKAIASLFSHNFGNNSKLVKAFQSGIFVHDGEIPNSIRNSIEFAAQRGKIKLLLCTNTLAQGVNLPIKTMLVTSVGQGSLKLKNRDLRNLIGRVGRSGIENEGNIIFVQGSDFANKNTGNAIRQLVENIPPENLGSSLLNLFQPTPVDPYNMQTELITSDQWFTADFLENPEEWVSNHISTDDLARAEVYRKKGEAVSKIEGFLMSLWDFIQMGNPTDNLRLIAESTYAYHISDSEDSRRDIENLFYFLYRKIVRLVTESDLTIYTKMLTGINESALMKNWVLENEPLIVNTNSLGQIISDLWPLLKHDLNPKEMEHDNLFQKLLEGWVMGTSYGDLLDVWKSFEGVKIKNKNPNVETVYNICDRLFQFNMAERVSAIAELIEDDVKKKRLYLLHTAIKSGLPTLTENAIYSIGLNDRYLSSQIALLTGDTSLTKGQVKDWISHHKNEIKQRENESLTRFFLKVLDEIV